MDNRYEYASREGIEDCMIWAGLSKEEIDKALDNYIPKYYDKVEHQYITLEEYNKRHSC